MGQVCHVHSFKVNLLSKPQKKKKKKKKPIFFWNGGKKLKVI
jgi:hypothetical protein